MSWISCEEVFLTWEIINNLIWKEESELSKNTFPLRMGIWEDILIKNARLENN